MYRTIIWSVHQQTHKYAEQYYKKKRENERAKGGKKKGGEEVFASKPRPFFFSKFRKYSFW